MSTVIEEATVDAVRGAMHDAGRATVDARKSPPAWRTRDTGDIICGWCGDSEASVLAPIPASDLAPGDQCTWCGNQQIWTTWTGRLWMSDANRLELRVGDRSYHGRFTRESYDAAAVDPYHLVRVDDDGLPCTRFAGGTVVEVVAGMGER